MIVTLFNGSIKIQKGEKSKMSIWPTQKLRQTVMMWACFTSKWLEGWKFVMVQLLMTYRMDNHIKPLVTANGHEGFLC